MHSRIRKPLMLRHDVFDFKAEVSDSVVADRAIGVCLGWLGRFKFEKFNKRVPSAEECDTSEED